MRRQLLDVLDDSFTDDGTRGQHHDSTARRTPRPIRARWPLLRDGGRGCRTGRVIAIGSRGAQPGDERLRTGGWWPEALGTFAGAVRTAIIGSCGRHHPIS
jgi:hypothetical protein